MTTPARLKNPYLSDPTCETRKIEFRISKQHLHELRSRCPQHGINDAVCSSIFNQFITQIIDRVPLALTADEAETNEQRIHDLIQSFKAHV